MSLSNSQMPKLKDSYLQNISRDSRKKNSLSAFNNIQSEMRFNQQASPSSYFSSNTSKLKEKLTELKKLSSPEGKKDYISQIIEEKRNDDLFEKKSTIIKQKQKLLNPKHKFFGQQNILNLINKKQKNYHLSKQTNETKFENKIETFKKIGTFIDLRQTIHKMNILEDEDFKDFLDIIKLETHPSNPDFNQNEDSIALKFSKSKEKHDEIKEKKFECVTKFKDKKLLKKIQSILDESKRKKKDQEINLSKQLMTSLIKKEENDDRPDEEFYQKIDQYLSNEKLLQNLSKADKVSEAPPHDQTSFSEFKKIKEASILAENYQAFKEIQEIKTLLKSLGINLNHSEKDVIETSYSINYTQQVNNFRKTLRNASLEALRKNMEEYNNSKKSFGDRRNALALTSNKSQRMAIMRNTPGNHSKIFLSALDKSNENSLFPIKNIILGNSSIEKNFDKNYYNNKKLNNRRKNLPKSTVYFKNGGASTKPTETNENEDKGSFTYNKYHAYLSLINGNSPANLQVNYKLKNNLSRTFDCFVNDVKELEKTNDIESHGINERIKNFNNKYGEISQKYEPETENMKRLSIYDISEQENNINIHHLRIKRHKKMQN